MSIRSRLNSLLQLVVIGGLLYVGYQWQFGESDAGGARQHAESSCSSAISARFGNQNVRPYSVEENASGYVVRASINVRGGTPAKVICLTNSFGGVEDISIVEH